jgi:lipopolysaccharide transport system ATP-binding protein
VLPAPVAAVTLDYGTLLVVTCAVTRTDGVEVQRDAAGRGKAVITFPKLALRKGEYRVSVYLACENALHIYDHVAGAASLDVTDDLREPGLGHLPHTWKCSAETAHEIPTATRRAGLDSLT